jgi:hypothetical protein
MTLGSDAVLTEAEANRLIASLEEEVQLGYFDPCVIDWRDQLRECATSFNSCASQRRFGVVGWVTDGCGRCAYPSCKLLDLSEEMLEATDNPAPVRSP